jgi:hypothetical protein
MIHRHVMAGQTLFLMFDFMADDAANGSTADGSDRAAAGKNGAADGADTRADGGVPVLRRHPGTRTQAEQHGGGNGTERGSLKRINGVELVHYRSLM